MYAVMQTHRNPGILRKMLKKCSTQAIIKEISSCVFYQPKRSLNNGKEKRINKILSDNHQNDEVYLKVCGNTCLLAPIQVVKSLSIQSSLILPKISIRASLFSPHSPMITGFIFDQFSSIPSMVSPSATLNFLPKLIRPKD